GRVPHRSAQLPGVAMWQVDAAHGKLPEAAQAFAAYLDLLTDGTTTRLPRMESIPADAAPQERGAASRAPVRALAHSRPSRRWQDVTPPDTPSDLMDASAAREPADAGEALVVRVVNGDIQFVRDPMMVGHYRSLQLTGSERIVNRLVGEAMARSLATGLYPE